MFKLVTSLILAAVVATQAQVPDQECERDIIFALDISGSINIDKPFGDPLNVDLVLNFTKDCIDLLPVSEGKVRVGVLTFSNQ